MSLAVICCLGQPRKTRGVARPLAVAGEKKHESIGIHAILRCQRVRMPRPKTGSWFRRPVGSAGSFTRAAPVSLRATRARAKKKKNDGGIIASAAGLWLFCLLAPSYVPTHITRVRVVAHWHAYGCGGKSGKGKRAALVDSTLYTRARRAMLEGRGVACVTPLGLSLSRSRMIPSPPPSITTTSSTNPTTAYAYMQSIYAAFLSIANTQGFSG